MSTEVISKKDMIPKKQKRPPKRRSWSLEKRRATAGYIFVLPWIIGFCAFMAFPLFTSLIYSFNTVKIANGGVQMTPYGWNNYLDIFVGDITFLPDFADSIRMTVLWTPFIVVFALFIALLLNRKIKFRGAFRLIYFLPVLLGTGYVFQQLSVVTEMISIPQSLSRSMMYFFGSDLSASIQDLIKEILRVFWKTGVQIVIFLSGLQSIPDSLYEAAKVDNANGWDMLWKVTIPILSPVILLNTIYTIIDSFRDQSNPIVMHIVKTINASQYGPGTAMGWLYFLVSFIIIGFVFLIMRRAVYYEK